jgi:hypothetical protein
LRKRYTFTTSNRYDEHRTSSWHIIVKTIRTEKNKRILKTVKKKKTPYKTKPIKITDFLMEILKATRAWSEVFWALKENNFNPRILYPAKV